MRIKARVRLRLRATYSRARNGRGLGSINHLMIYGYDEPTARFAVPRNVRLRLVLEYNYYYYFWIRFFFFFLYFVVPRQVLKRFWIGGGLQYFMANRWATVLQRQWAKAEI